MKILFNSSNNVVGGAVQNAANFVKYALRDSSVNYLFLVSNEIYELLNRWGISDNRIYATVSPAISRNARKRIKKIEKDYCPDLVYTMAGPTYIRFKSPHVMGISDPYITHSNYFNFRYNRSFFASFKLFLKTVLKSLNARFGADFYLFQTKTSQAGFCHRFWWPVKNTELVANAIGEGFYKKLDPVSNLPGDHQVVIFCPSAYYPHKNLEIIEELAYNFRNTKKVKFIITIPEKSNLAIKLAKLPLSNITNIGPYSYAEAADLYAASNIVFIPSLLETFSTSYLEAIAAKKPLVVANTEFAKEICGEYAEFYSPTDVADAYSVLLNTIKSGMAIDASQREPILSRYGTQKERYETIKNILLRV